MDKRDFLTLAVIILTASAIVVYGSKLPASQAQASNPILLSITGIVETPLNLTVGDIKAMPQTTVLASLYCVGSPRTPLNEGAWTGVELSYLLQQANVSPNAIKVAFLATDGFATDLTIQMATQNSDILVAYQKDNQSLGGLQLVVPFHWGYKWISSLIKIQLVNYDFLGTYESQGYSDEGTISGVGPLPDFQQSQASTNPTSNPTTMTQKSTPSPTNLSPSLNPTIYPTESPVELNSQPQLTSTSPILLYIAIFFVVIVTSTLASVSILIKRKKTKSKL